MSKDPHHVLKSFLYGLIAFALIQAVPYGRTWTNPPVVREPVWDSPATRDLARRACFDCHSNETIWPWYARIAPISWLVRYDVDEGRSELNFSDWQSGDREGERPGKIEREISTGKMPPFQYVSTHPGARLAAVEKRRLIDGLKATAMHR